MTRTHYRHGATGAHDASTLDRPRATRKKKSYKVVMEVVTQEKKKLHSIMSYSADAPYGYTFVPLGNPDLTEYCKEKCRKRNLEVHIVSAKPKGRVPSEPNTDSAPRIDTQRVGYHFPNAIIDEACDFLGYYFRNGRFQKSSRNYEETRLARSLHNYGQRMQLQGRPATETQTRDQIRSAILEVFPKVPEADLNAIVKHAFEEGTKRVGNATDLSLARRVQLAVGAYVRHQYTDYDNILKSGVSWPEARQKAQPLSYAKLKEWRDEADTSNELEETFREIIVLDDDDDDYQIDTSEDGDNGLERGNSLEVFSSRATARELQPEDAVSFARADEASTGGSRQRRVVLRPFNRSHRTHGVAPSSRALSPRKVIRVDARPPPLQASLARPVPRAPEPMLNYKGEPRSTIIAPEPVSLAPQPQKTIRGSDGKLYSLYPIEDTPARHAEFTFGAPLKSSHHPYGQGYVDPLRRVNSLEKPPSNRPSPLPLSRRHSGEDVVLPSIESESDALASPRHFKNPSRAHMHGHQAGYTVPHGMIQQELHSPKRQALPPADTSRRDYYHPAQVSKRLRPVYSDEPGEPPPHATFHRFNDRPLMEHNDRPRERTPPQHDVIDLTYSPLRRTTRVNDVHAVPARSHAAVAPSVHPPLADPPYRNYAHVSGYERVHERRPAPQCDYVDFIDPGPRTNAVHEGRFTRDRVQYIPRGPH